MARGNQQPHPAESPASRVAHVARVGARYGFGFIFARRLTSRRRRVDPARVGTRLRLAFEELGPTFCELGRFLAARRDRIPPGVTRELERATSVPKPVRFESVRRLIERELDNDLERLFVSFDEHPLRTGVFTQSHRAVLPGGHHALVVVNRPGIRRELLTMRPVAELVRRRTANRLPLDPSEEVVEFIAHTTQRRDMYAAVRNVHRMRAFEQPGVVVPTSYKGYCSARLATFAFPQDPHPPDAGELRAVTRYITRLALFEGLFPADLRAERLFAGEGGIWVADPTEFLSVDPERLRGLAELLDAISRDDVEATLRALPSAGCTAPEDDATLRRGLRDTMGSLGGPFWRERTLSEVVARGLETARQGGVKVPLELVLLFRSLVAAESLVREKDESYTAMGDFSEAAREMISRSRDPREVASRTARKLLQPETYADYPRQIHAVLTELKDGEVEVRFNHEGVEDLISKVDILANRLVFALLIAALVVSSSVIGIFVRGGAHFLGMSVFGLAGFAVAAVLGLALLVGIIRSGRL